MNRREMLTTSGLGVAGFAVGSAFTAPACSPKDLSGWIVTLTADYGEIKPLLPQLGLGQAAITRVSSLIDKVIAVAEQFDAAYRKGDFQNASTLFTSLGGLVTDIAAQLSVANNRIVNLLLVGIQIARITIASLLKVQADAQPVIRTARKSAAQQTAVDEIQRLASIDVSKLLAAIQ